MGERRQSSPTSEMLQNVLQKHFGKPEMFAVAASVLAPTSPQESSAARTSDESPMPSDTTSAAASFSFTRHGRGISGVSGTSDTHSKASSVSHTPSGSSHGTRHLTSTTGPFDSEDWSDMTTPSRPARVTALHLPTREGGRVNVSINAVLNDPLAPRVLVEAQNASPTTRQSLQQDDDDEEVFPAFPPRQGQHSRSPMRATALLPDDHEVDDIEHVITRAAGAMPRADLALTSKVLQAVEQARPHVQSNTSTLQVGTMTFDGHAWKPTLDAQAGEDAAMAEFDDIISSPTPTLAASNSRSTLGSGGPPVAAGGARGRVVAPPRAPVPSSFPVTASSGHSDSEEEDWDSPPAATPTTGTGAGAGFGVSGSGGGKGTATAAPVPSSLHSPLSLADAAAMAAAMRARLTASGGGLKSITMADMRQQQQQQPQPNNPGVGVYRAGTADSMTQFFPSSGTTHSNAAGSHPPSLEEGGGGSSGGGAVAAPHSHGQVQGRLENLIQRLHHVGREGSDESSSAGVRTAHPPHAPLGRAMLQGKSADSESHSREGEGGAVAFSLTPADTSAFTITSELRDAFLKSERQHKALARSWGRLSGSGPWATPLTAEVHSLNAATSEGKVGQSASPAAAPCGGSAKPLLRDPAGTRGGGGGGGGAYLKHTPAWLDTVAAAQSPNDRLSASDTNTAATGGGSGVEEGSSAALQAPFAGHGSPSRAGVAGFSRNVREVLIRAVPATGSSTSSASGRHNNGEFAATPSSRESRLSPFYSIHRTGGGDASGVTLARRTGAVSNVGSGMPGSGNSGKRASPLGAGTGTGGGAGHAMRATSITTVTSLKGTPGASGAFVRAGTSSTAAALTRLGSSGSAGSTRSQHGHGRSATFHWGMEGRSPPPAPPTGDGHVSGHARSSSLPSVFHFGAPVRDQVGLSADAVRARLDRTAAESTRGEIQRLRDRLAFHKAQAEAAAESTVSAASSGEAVTDAEVH